MLNAFKLIYFNNNNNKTKTKAKAKTKTTKKNQTFLPTVPLNFLKINKIDIIIDI